MLLMLRVALAAAVGLALVAALYRGWWRRVPVFTLYLAAQLPLLIGYRPESREWLTSMWVPLEPLVVLLRVGVAIEAFMVHAKENLRLAGMSLAALAVALVVLVVRALPVEPQPMIVETRRYAQIWAGAFLLLYAALALQVDKLHSGWQRTHLLILLVILSNHAAVSVASLRGQWAAGWWIVSPVSFAVATTGYLCWALFCLRAERSDPRGRSAAD